MYFLQIVVNPSSAILVTLDFFLIVLNVSRFFIALNENQANSIFSDLCLTVCDISIPRIKSRKGKGIRRASD